MALPSAHEARSPHSSDALPEPVLPTIRPYSCVGFIPSNKRHICRNRAQSGDRFAGIKTTSRERLATSPFSKIYRKALLFPIAIAHGFGAIATAQLLWQVRFGGVAAGFGLGQGTEGGGGEVIWGVVSHWGAALWGSSL